MPDQLVAATVPQLDDLKELANIQGPCITIFVPREHAENTSRFEVQRLRSALKSAEQALAARRMNPDEINQLLDPIRSFTTELPTPVEARTQTFVILRSSDMLRTFEVPQHLEEAAFVSEHFNVLPILGSLLEADQQFYILALSQKHARLLRCTRESSEETPLPEGTPHSLNEWLNTRMPNESPSREGSDAEQGQPAGSFNSTHDRDNKDEHLSNFYHAVAKGVHEALRDHKEPLVLAGVEYEISMYQSINKYPHILEAGVHGSPDSLKGGELHKRALELIEAHSKSPIEKALGIYERNGGSERVTDDSKTVLKAAHQGRISHLFVAEGASLKGSFDMTTMTPKMAPEGEDLVNVAALQTIAFGGDVLLTPQGLVPGGGPMAAILRY